MSYHDQDNRLQWFRHLLVPFLWLLLIGTFVFILVSAPNSAAGLALMFLAGLGVLGTWFLLR